jgi:ArsR family transcriptional regulator
MECNDICLKAIADETRLEIVKLLVGRSYCVGALARRLELSEAAISQHLKVLREAGFLVGEKHGYFMHYDVNRDALRALAAAFEELAAVKREPCEPESEGCMQKRQLKCHVHTFGEKCSEELLHSCHGQAHSVSRGKGKCSHHKHPEV